MDVDQYMEELGRAARAASRHVAASATAVRNHALLATRDAIDAAREQLMDANAEDLAQGEAVQFERLGYFCLDSADHSAGAPVLNRIVTLRDSWAKIEKQAMS